MKLAQMFLGLIGLVFITQVGQAANIQTDFDSFSGFSTGQSTFTLNDVENSNFSLTASGAGQIVFFRDPALYFLNSNRSFGVSGGKSATLVFPNRLASEVTVFGQDTNGDNDNENGEILGDANGAIEAFDQNGTSLGVFEFPEDSFGEWTFSSESGIASLELRNDSLVRGSWSLLGAISATAVPEPVEPTWLLCCLALLWVRRTVYLRRRV